MPTDDDDDEIIIIRGGRVRVERSALSDEEQECIADLGAMEEPLTAIQAYALAHLLARALRRP